MYEILSLYELKRSIEIYKVFNFFARFALVIFLIGMISIAVLMSFK